MVLRSLVVFSGRVPMIKFRKGGFAGAATMTSSGASPGGASASAPPPPSAAQAASVQEPQYSSNAIEDWELPARYRRAPITQDEMDYINRGGPA